MTKKSTGIVLALLAAFLLLTSGFFLGRRATGGVRITADRSAAEMTAEQDLTPSPDVRGIIAQTEQPDPAARLNINTATAEQLEQLPQIGEVLASRIIAYRSSHGAFTSITELMNVEGIGEGRLDAIKDLITVR